VVTQVQAQMSFNTGSVTTKLYSPKGSPAVVRSMQALKQSVKGGTATAGVPGTAGNSFPTYTAGAGGKTSSTSTQLTQDFALSQQDTRTVLAPGTITRLSVAVVVGAKLTAAQLALVKSTVQAAVGAYPAQKNQVTVVAMPFNHALLHGLTAGAPVAPASRLLVPALIGVGVLLLVLVVVLVLRRRAPAVGVDDGAGATLASGVSVGVSPGADDPLGSAIASAQAVRDRLQGALKQRPEDVARVIRVWLDQTE
jgi:flagellar biosynthesis/type III secretory pathway M-ring protein FliF/YscJ